MEEQQIDNESDFITTEEFNNNSEYNENDIEEIIKDESIQSVFDDWIETQI
jgi:hypothetical protein